MHIALIPDGNRRYAKKHALTFEEVYRKGMEKFREFVEWCSEFDVNEITAYALSLENIEKRSKTELETLAKVLIEEIEKTKNDERIHKNQINIKICGNLDSIKRLNKDLFDALMDLEYATKNYSKNRVNLAVGYGGRQEIMNVIEKFRNSNEEINDENIRKNLMINNYPDLLIRTGGHRISNFLLWQIAYTEIYFLNKLWPEFEKQDLINIIEDYKKTEKRFGK
ncbi:MAG: polyprenyl diphosphate synthase [Candidatus Altarchaeaceae archaeon]